MTRDDQPRSTVEQLIKRFLPHVCQRFLLSQSESFNLGYVTIRGLFGALSGAVMFLIIAPGLALNFDLKLMTGAIFTGLCLVGGALSSAFRCAILLMFPSMLGSRGRTFIMLLILSALYTGPVSNIQHNVEAAATSLSCNLDLQVQNAKLLWKDAVKPFREVAQRVIEGEEQFKSDTGNTRAVFDAIRKEVFAQDGNDKSQAKNTSTQEQFTLGTLSRCEGVVKHGIQSCTDWFENKYKECLNAINVPYIMHALCWPMKFDFLCNIMQVMTGWCEENIPVEKNFGQLFDKLDTSVDLLRTQFSSQLVVKVETRNKSALDGQLMEGDFKREIETTIQKLTARTSQVVGVLRLIMSFTFISMFTQSLGYVRKFRGDLYFDNMYVTKYFGIIDQRRMSSGKRYLLPLTKSERRKFVDPWSPKIHPKELREVVSSVFQVLSAILLAAVLFTVDISVFRVLDVVTKHTHTTFNFSSSQKVDIQVDGDSMMARLLKKSFAAFNVSSSVRVMSDNKDCLTPPTSLDVSAYGWVGWCILLAALFSCLQIYANRLRRVIAAFCYPRREKKRILFLYNLSLYRRMLHKPTHTDHARIQAWAWFSWLCRWLRCLSVCFCQLRLWQWCCWPCQWQKCQPAWFSRLCPWRRERSSSDQQSQV
ncbi:E3 ubiquitin-protein ligase DCST1 [Corythoichthys intestinalis]|uniref:E3 ubiquitin-protein ligase DCST1 n=1 Tax=Corythoichthys intestinalis TaxID=161448 RepID=UPI0025A68ADD|nr:E3 ubiquitin-protein ligase DCST1 [Corythoichthys intestinalis]